MFTTPYLSSTVFILAHTFVRLFGLLQVVQQYPVCCHNILELDKAHLQEDPKVFGVVAGGRRLECCRHAIIFRPERGERGEREKLAIQLSIRQWKKALYICEILMEALSTIRTSSFSMRLCTACK